MNAVIGLFAAASLFASGGIFGPSAGTTGGSDGLKGDGYESNYANVPVAICYRGKNYRVRQHRLPEMIARGAKIGVCR